MFFPADAAAERHCSELRVLRFSMNAPVVALEGLPVGPARAAVALHAGAEPRITIALRATRSGQTLFYCAGEELAEFSSASVVVDAALSFAESMGFLFDDDEVESRGEEGRSEAARLWADFIDELPEHSAAVPEPVAASSLWALPGPAAPNRPPSAPRSIPNAPPAAASRPARVASGDLSPLPAILPDGLQIPDLPRAPLAMLDDDGPSDALPFWLLQPDPPRRSSARTQPAPGPKPAPVPVHPPAAPLEPEAAADREIGLERKPRVPPRPRTPVARRVEEPTREAREPAQPPASGTQPRARASEASNDLHAVLAGTGVDQLLRSARAAAAAQAAAPRLSKFRFPAPAAALRAAPPAPEVEPVGEAQPGERQEFESLSLRLRSRF